MDVLKIIGIVIGGIIVLSAVYTYTEHLKELKGRSIFSSGTIILLAIAEVLVVYALADKNNLRIDNYIALLAVAAVIFCGCLIANIVNYKFIHGFLVTIIQSISAVASLVLVVIVASLIDGALNRRRTHN